MDQAGIAMTLELAGAPLRHTVFAAGADMKNAVAMAHGRTVCLSPFLGALETPEAVERFEQVAAGFPGVAGLKPDTVAVDLHPDMQSTRFGRKLAREWGCPVVEVQHHHAHAAACLAENGEREGLVLVMDGTGWGGDGTIWGAELLEVKGAATFRRLASFCPVPLPGGDAAVRQPARQVVGRWIRAGVELTEQRLGSLGVTRDEAAIWEQQCRRKLNAPPTHAAGRVFDSFSALLGLAPRDITHEGEPAILLEEAAGKWQGGEVPTLPFGTREENGLLLVDWAPAFRLLSDVAASRREPARWAMAAHVAIARAAGIMIDYAVSRGSGKRVGLSGGVFLNRILNRLLDEHLGAAGISVLRHKAMPPGDGCIALGQAVVAGIGFEI